MEGRGRSTSNLWVEKTNGRVGSRQCSRATEGKQKYAELGQSICLFVWQGVAGLKFHPARRDLRMPRFLAMMRLRLAILFFSSDPTGG